MKNMQCGISAKDIGDLWMGVSKRFIKRRDMEVMFRIHT